MMRRVICGAAAVPLFLVTMAGCPDQADPATLPDGVTSISRNMVGIWNSPGGPGCKWVLRFKDANGRWVVKASGSGNHSQTVIIGTSVVDIGQLRSDKCGGWKR